MKRALFILATAVSALAAFSDTSPESEPASFKPELTGLLARYEGTLPPALPDHENRSRIKRETSSVPGRMHVPRAITVDKERCRIYLFNAFGDTLMRAPVCSSRNKGQKQGKDDWRTPEGTFKMYGVYNSTDWTYEDTDDKCYGPFFLSLKTQRYWGIGIHGTNSPSSVPGRRSHGCMRLHNEDIVRLKKLVNKDLLVTVLPDHVAPKADEAD